MLTVGSSEFLGTFASVISYQVNTSSIVKARLNITFIYLVLAGGTIKTRRTQTRVAEGVIHTSSIVSARVVHTVICIHVA